MMRHHPFGENRVKELIDQKNQWHDIDDIDHNKTF
jgi:hypothetical protein